MPNSREEILRRLGSERRPAVALPDLRGIGPQYPDLREQFAKSVADVAGRCLLVADDTALNAELARLPEFVSARKILSLVTGIQRANVDLAGVADAHELADLDFCVLPGELGVAENGAVWVRENGSPHRAAWFLAQHVALVLPGSGIVSTMHDAYDRLSLGAPGFGVFISGPSKTADIEQALVIGAQGPRSCTVLVIGG